MTNRNGLLRTGTALLLAGTLAAGPGPAVVTAAAADNAPVTVDQQAAEPTAPKQPAGPETPSQKISETLRFRLQNGAPASYGTPLTIEFYDAQAPEKLISTKELAATQDETPTAANSEITISDADGFQPGKSYAIKLKAGDEAWQAVPGTIVFTAAKEAVQIDVDRFALLKGVKQFQLVDEAGQPVQAVVRAIPNIVNGEQEADVQQSDEQGLVTFSTADAGFRRTVIYHLAVEGYTFTDGVLNWNLLGGEKGTDVTKLTVVKVDPQPVPVPDPSPVPAPQPVPAPDPTPAPQPQADPRTSVTGAVYIASGTAPQYHWDAQTNQLTPKDAAFDLTQGTGWQIAWRLVTPNGDVYYSVANDSYVAAKDVVRTQGFQKLRGVVTVNASGAALRQGTTDSDGAISRQLPAGSQWQFYGIAKNADGTSAYLLGGNQWISTTQADISTGQTHGVFRVDAAATETVDRNGQTLARTLPAGSGWRVASLRTFHGQLYYQVAANVFVPAVAGAYQAQD
ncbi:hypothetical protein [Schleiferilactobacillus harbinensis]|jgi:hypothetical protein|uniref:hypothetical protein n=1 Tax=Schleiferilactobacillus harbinensis TaxID=304207 RepID=UPI0012398EB7|nr:hypothetical protein [Schleiferilactobacillus harbinensis]MCI1688328.1 hypothetical protein [Schleiferilactobacillus harbinensis]MCI1783858.1 hypothetical protein [Schleiferilactobacillus harbinensis]MCI1851285.1 hypothetical protein [Schleiferilactobacillus harbinensis]QEU47526.1 hypothetical protein FMM01_09595 [Schleiferilactobacillus harbinensis]